MLVSEEFVLSCRLGDFLINVTVLCETRLGDIWLTSMKQIDMNVYFREDFHSPCRTTVGKKGSRTRM